MPKIILFSKFLCHNLKLTRTLLFSSNISSIITASRSNSSNSQTNKPGLEEMKIEEISIPVPWGAIRGQVFGDRSHRDAKPILCLHGYLDNSNSFRPIAPYLSKTNEFYLIALDFPGHGLSSKLPDGIPYTPKLFVASVRRAVRYLNLAKFYFMSHSYGIGTSFFYQTLFKNEVLGTIALDWIFNDFEDRWKNMDELWRQGIDLFIDQELMDLDESNKKNEQKELTHDLALSLLLKANPGLNEESAKILLERALIVDENGKLTFSRDKKVKTSVMNSDHYGEFVFIRPHIKLAAPLLTIHAAPPSYGEEKGENTLKVIEKLRTNSLSFVETVFLDGSHHLHMTKPRETANIVLNFLNKIKTLGLANEQSKL